MDDWVIKVVQAVKDKEKFFDINQIAKVIGNEENYLIIFNNCSIMCKGKIITNAI